MSIEYVKQDITTIQHGIIAHGCNCSGGFGSGVAGAIARKWPHVKDMFHQVPPSPTLLGWTHIVWADMPHVRIANMYTQVKYGNDGEVYADPDAIEKALLFVCQYAAEQNVPVYMPPIGCGLGGLDWDADVLPRVNNVIQALGDKCPSIIVCDI
jgi:O-acetyl-ADP-ribose deacetylase (regulator of RNase III)